MKIQKREIVLKGLKFHAKIGVHEEERILGNEIEVDIAITILLPQENLHDAIEETLDYAKVYDVIKMVMTEEMHLLETACEKITAALAAKFSTISEIKIAVSKLNPPLDGRVERVLVEEVWVRKN